MTLTEDRTKVPDRKLLRALPAVERLLGNPQLESLDLPRELVKRAVRQTLDQARQAILQGSSEEPAEERLADQAVNLARELDRPAFRQVINATGVVIHTNLGRSPLAQSALTAIADLARTYSNLEFDLSRGKRGSRYSLVVDLLKELTGAEAALVVNNNAAAVLVSLNSLALGREVVVSRGQLVEIGGSFRIPDVMTRAGAILTEVGATNKTHLRDYEAGINDRTAGLLKVHQSNFALVGFSQLVEIPELVELAHSRGLWVMDDLGSGCLLDLSPHGLPKEPTVSEALAEGADVVTFSGDKLLGGPQAGIIVGRREIVERIQKNPINRAVRIDKMTLAALGATLRLYRDRDRALTEIPTLRMLTATEQNLAGRASRLKSSISGALSEAGAEGVAVNLVKGLSQVGGGSLPLAKLPTRLIGIASESLSAARVEKHFRAWTRPIIGRVEEDLFLIDPRTLLTGDGAEICRATVALAGRG